MNGYAEVLGEKQGVRHRTGLKASSVVGGWAAFIVFFALLLVPNLIDTTSRSPMGDLERIETPVFAVCFWLVWFALFGRLWLGTLIAALACAWWWPFDLYMRTQFGTPITSTTMAFASETNASEALNFASSSNWPMLLGCFVVVASVCALTIILTRRTGLSWTHRSRYWIMLILPAAGALSYATFDAQERTFDVKPTPDMFRVEPAGFWASKWFRVFPFDMPLSMSRYFEERDRVMELRKKVDSFSFAASQSGVAADIIVVVIGESSRVDRWSLAGYPRETNPNLKARSNLYFLPNVISRSVATRTAVPSIVSRQPVLMPDGTPNQFVEPSFLRALEEVGYSTHWISNQSGTGFFDTSSMFNARDAQHVQLTNPTSFSSRGAFDEALLKPLEEAVSSAKRTAVVLHTMGSHFNYANRYPAEFDKFQPSLRPGIESSADLASLKREVSNAYDNTVAYTDYVMDRIIQTVAATNRSAAVIYVSDHGQDLFEPGCLTSDATIRGGVNSYRVPAFVWLSDQLISVRPGAAKALSSARLRPQANDFVFSTVLDLAGTSVRQSRASSLGVGLFDSEPVSRSVAGRGGASIDFDKAASVNSCQI